MGKCKGMWRSIPIKYIADCNTEVLPESTDENMTLKYIDIGSVNYGEGICSIQELTFSDSPSRARRIVHLGDTIISTVRTYLKAIAYISEEYSGNICSTGFAVLTPHNVDAKFFFYALNSDAFVSTVEKYSYGVSYPAITAKALTDLKLTLPPIDMQQCIASYLDMKISRIGECIFQLQTQLSMLTRYKRDLIAECVTKGLDKSAPMRPSGEDWIGDVPEHWQILPLRAFTKRNDRKNPGNLPLLSVERERGVVNRETDGSPDNYNRVPDDLSNYKMVKKGQFVMNKMKAWQGSYGVAPCDGIVSPAYYVYDLNFPNKDFFNYAIRGKCYIGFFGRDSYGIRTDQWDFKAECIKHIPFVVPPVDEQKNIVSYLDEKLKIIEKLTTDIEAQIQKLKDYRRILIHDAVTGKIKI